MNQLMNKETYEREQKQKEHGRAAKRQKINRDEQSRLIQHTSNQGSREMVVDGLRFQLRTDGSKLLRISGKHGGPDRYRGTSKLNAADARDTSKETPKKVKIADVDFFRTKHGNLVRANAVKDLNRYCLMTQTYSNSHDSFSNFYRPLHRKQKPQCEHFIKHGTYSSFQSAAVQPPPRRKRYRTKVVGRSPRSLLIFHTGTCPRGPTCKFSHDPEKVAICKTFLHTGTCTAGANCDLSHNPSYHRVPACTHFLRGNCTNDACRYPHVYVSPAASVCRSFSLTGYCDKGEDCAKRHAIECADYANHGYCADRENGKCPLPHPDHASTLRKAAARQAKTGSENESDMSSDEEPEEDDHAGLDDIDSDEAEDVMMGGADDGSLTQQHDFIAFS